LKNPFNEITELMSKNKVKKAISYILAEGEDFTLENRLLLSSLAIGMLLNIFAAFINSILSTSIIAIAVPLILAVVVLLLYYFVRYRKVGEIVTTITVVITIIGVAIIWVFNGGINSGNIMPAFVVLLLSLIVVPDKFKKYIIILFIGANIFVLLIQFYKPEVIVPFPTETDRWIDTLISLIYSSYFIYLVIMFILKNYNIEKRRAEENEKKFRLLYDNSPDMYLSVSAADATIIMCNQTFMNVLGYSKDEIIGKPVASFNYFENPDEPKNNFNHFLKTGTFRNKELIVIKKDGTKIHVSLNADAVRDENQKILHSISSYRDITLQKKAELLIMEQNKELVKLNQDKDQFMSILAHDLRSPLSSLQGFSDFLLGHFHEYDKKQIEEQLSIINAISHQTFELLDDLLLWSKSQSGKLPFEPIKIDFYEFCAELSQSFSYQAKTKKISLLNLVPAKTLVIADANMLKTVLRNLLSNAIKFTHENGQVRIFAEISESTALITVSDNGIGIEKETLKNLWNLTLTLSHEGTGGEKGTGFGLLLCKEFVERHGGKIWVEGEQGKGSDFKFTLPVH
jgi:two-component system sensor histidine kinase/response regulator